MTAKNDEYLMEVTKTLYNLNADDMVVRHEWTQSFRNSIC